MEWFFFTGLGILWAAFLLPPDRGLRRRRSPTDTVEEFGVKMDLLEQTERGGGPGRWLVAPKKGELFLGTRARHRARVRARRRQAFMVLLEAIGITFLIGLFPPLRGMWWVTVSLAGILGLYCLVLIHLKEVERIERERARQVRRRAPDPGRISTPPARVRREARSPYDSLGSLGEGDRVHVVVRLPGDLSALNAS